MPDREAIRASVSRFALQASLPSGGPEVAPSTSADGRFVAFTSLASLVAEDTNDDWDVYVRDMALGTLELVSVDHLGRAVEVNCNGEPTRPRVHDVDEARSVLHDADGTGLVEQVEETRPVSGVVAEIDRRDSCGAPGYLSSMSAEGRFVAFEHDGPLAPDDLNGDRDIYLRDRDLRMTVRITRTEGGGTHPSISADGAAIAFASEATDLVSDDQNNARDVFVWRRGSERLDPGAGPIDRVSVAPDGSDANGDSNHPAIAADGSHVAFDSAADNLSDEDGQFRDVFVRTLSEGGSTTLVSIGFDGSAADGHSQYPTISGDAAKIAFESTAQNLVDGLTKNNGGFDVYVGSSLGGAVALISAVPSLIGGSATTGNGPSHFAAISADGSVVAFRSGADDLVAGDTEVWDVFIRDVGSSSLELISIGPDEEPTDEASYWPSINADGSVVVFASAATVLVPGDTNGVTDTFVVRGHACSGGSSSSFAGGEVVHGVVEPAVGSSIGPVLHDAWCELGETTPAT